MNDWPMCPLQELVTKVGSGATPTGGEHAYKPVGTPLIRSMNVHFAGFRREGLAFLDDDQAADLNNAIVCTDDVLLNITGASIGRVTTVPTELDGARVNQHVCIIRPKEVLRSRFLSYFLASPQQQQRIMRVQVGATRQALTKSMILAFDVPVLPISTQDRIVAKIEELFSDLDAGVAALERVRAKLKRYRAAVLNAAVTGKLTEAWRRQNPPAEPADKLLARILEERRQKWEADQLRKFAEAGKTPPKGWKEKYAPPVEIDLTALPKLPSEWRWVALDAITSIAGGVTKGQRYDSDIELREVPYLRVANVQRGYLDLSEIKTIAVTKQDISDLRLFPGDVLFNEGGDRDKLGRGWVWNGEIDDCIHQNHVFRARAISADLQPKFISYHGNSFGRLWFLRTGKQSVNLASINMGVLRRFPVPLLPAAEQEQIVSEVERRLSVVDAVEAEVDHGLKRAARLRQAILKRAFEGKLVPQDPNDEPAAELLKRLKVTDHHGAAAGPEELKPRRQRKAATSVKEGLFDAR
jgi:type I restriction enzyme, S subunit